jgi:hypothetical protein
LDAVAAGAKATRTRQTFTPGAAMTRVDVATAWSPDVVVRMTIDERRWSYGIRAPFDMAPGIPELMGTRVLHDGKLFQVRGIVPSAPPSPIKEGELVELLVVAV